MGIFLVFASSCKKDDNNSDPTTLTDIDGNVYQVIKIGTQNWMKENLKTTRYNDGTAIPLVSDPTEWGTIATPGYCWYNNDQSTYGKTYGALYNWYAVNTGKLAPAGWHVPTDDDWTKLTNYLGGDSIAGGKLKSADTLYWISPNTGATNESGFTALPAGDRSENGAFASVGTYGSWWCSTENAPGNAWYRDMYYKGGHVGRYINYERSGFSIRLIKN